MRNRKGIAVAIALLFAVSGCKTGGDDSSKGKASPKPHRSTAATEPVKKAGSYVLPSERITIADKLSLPKMEGWKYAADSVYIDTSASCDSNPTSTNFSCPLLMVHRPGGTTKLKDVLTGDRIPCNSYAPFRNEKPIGSDVVDGVRTDRYYTDLRDCKTLPKGDTRSTRTTFWYFDHGGEFFGILALDAPNGGPKFDVEKLSFALRHAKWLS
jgi:hypothetical protein